MIDSLKKLLSPAISEKDYIILPNGNTICVDKLRKDIVLSTIQAVRDELAQGPYTYCGKEGTCHYAHSFLDELIFEFKELEKS